MVVRCMNKWLRFTTKLFIPGSRVSLCQVCTTEIITLVCRWQNKGMENENREVVFEFGKVQVSRERLTT